MSTTIIILIIAYVIISKIMGRNGHNLPERPTGRLPGDSEQSRPDYAASRSEEGPLAGPWDTAPRSEGGPLAGPWDTSTRGDDAPLPGPWEPDRSNDAEDKPQSLPERENEPQTPRRERKQAYPAGEPALELGEQGYDRPRKLSKAAAEIACPVDRAGASLRQPSPASPERRHRYAGNPLAAALHSKNALVGSIIIGDVLNFRGGRIKRKPGQF